MEPSGTIARFYMYVILYHKLLYDFKANKQFYMAEKYLLGRIYYKEKNYEKAYNIFKELEEKYNDGRAINMLGKMYYNGKFVEKNRMNIFIN